jgi:hypothetical protein
VNRVVREWAVVAAFENIDTLRMFPALDVVKSCLLLENIS